MKIIFLNVWGKEMQDSLVPYLHEQARDTDIFCFQEAFPEMKRRCGDILSDYDEIQDSKQIGERDSFLQSTFVKKGMDVQSSGTLMGGAMDRGLAVYVEVKCEGQNVFVCNVHGKARPSEKLDDSGRIGQSEDIINFFKDCSAPVVIGGDFNILPETRSIQMFEESGYRDLIKEYAVATTRNHLAWDRYPTPMYYSDYVFLNHHVELRSFDVPKNEVSDHLPMIVTFKAVATE